MENKSFDKKIVKYLLLLAALILGIIYFSAIVGAALSFWGIISPIAIGFVIAYILNILMKPINRLYFPKSKNRWINQSRKSVVLLLSIIVIVFVFISIVYLVLPQIFNTFAAIGENFPGFVDDVNRFITANKDHFPEIAKKVDSLHIDWNNISASITSYLSKGVSGIFSSSINIASSLASGVIGLFLSVTFAIYLVLEKDKLVPQIKRVEEAYLKKAHMIKLNTVLAVANESFTNFITGQCTEAVILGTLCVLGMFLFGFPYAVSIGVFVGVTALIPMVGAYLGSIVGFFLIFMVDPIQALWFLLYISTLQQLEGNLIYPKVMGTSIGLPGIWVLTAVVIGGGLSGVVGMLLGVPIAATLYKLMKTATRERLAKLALELPTEEQSNEAD